MKKTLILSALCIALGGRLSHASPITFTEQVIASGSLGATSFTDALVTVAFTSDTINVCSDASGPYMDTSCGPTSAQSIETVNVAGIGTATFIEDSTYGTLRIWENQLLFPAVLIEFGSGSVGTFGVPFATYDLITNLGPEPGSSFVSGFGSSLPSTFGSNPTDLGLFTLSSVTGDATFTATVAPEPTTLVLVLSGSCLCFGLRRFRSRRG